MMSSPRSSSTLRRLALTGGDGRRPAGRAARRARHVDRADDVLSGGRPDCERAVARRAGSARRSAAARSVARQSVRRQGRRWPQAGRPPRRRRSGGPRARRRARPARHRLSQQPERDRDARGQIQSVPEGRRARRGVGDESQPQRDRRGGARALLALREEPGVLGSADRGAGRSAARLHARARRRAQSVRRRGPIRIFRCA